MNAADWCFLLLAAAFLVLYLLAAWERDRYAARAAELSKTVHTQAVVLTELLAARPDAAVVDLRSARAPGQRWPS